MDDARTAQPHDAPGAWAAIAAAASDIKLAHSVFALPFALLAGAMALPPEQPWTRTGAHLLLIVLCMVLARTWAMLFNRIADRRFDAENPRTSRRALASGRLGVSQAWTIALASAGGFWIAASLFWIWLGNPWPAMLAPLVLVWIAFYSLTKRFTALCHVFLGGALAASPLAAALAVDPASLAHAPIWLLSLMVMLWVAGFDAIYALQDIDFDRAHDLHSIPARLGRAAAAWISRGLHLLAFGALVLAHAADARFGAIFGAGVFLSGVLLVFEHVVLARRGNAGLDMAFFTLNGVVSVVLGLTGLADLVI